uniref:Uncharacterized protein n=1 Tax=Pithovirus LCPAC406 TaxID=2506599 RepID=A0A481ZEQ8_9VIRU|nr:MAG: hypothetical protein LCPAC406_01790 [Pithovirus LCPAC406]
MIKYYTIDNNLEDYKEEVYENVNMHFYSILKDEKALKTQLAGMTKEFVVIASASSEIRGTYTKFNFGLSTAMVLNKFRSGFEYDRTAAVGISDKISSKIKDLTRIVDPNLYIMTYSVMSTHNLMDLDIFDDRNYY